MAKVTIGNKEFEARDGSEMDWATWLRISRNYNDLQQETDQLLLLVKVFDLMQQLVPELEESDLEGVPLDSMSDVLTSIMSAVNGGKAAEEDDDEEDTEGASKKD